MLAAGGFWMHRCPLTWSACRLLRFDYLADHMEQAPLLAEWHFREWQELLPHWTYAAALAELQAQTGRRQIPTTILLWEEGQLLGSASLIVSDPPGWEQLTPWLASVYLIPEARGRRLGQRLVQRMIEEAAALTVPVLYLFTSGQTGFYQKLGWRIWRSIEHHGRQADIMFLHPGKAV